MFLQTITWTPQHPLVALDLKALSYSNHLQNPLSDWNDKNPVIMNNFTGHGNVSECIFPWKSLKITVLAPL